MRDESNRSGWAFNRAFNGPFNWACGGACRRALAAAAGLTLSLGVALSGTARGQDSQPPLEQQLRDFIFYVNINRDDAAALQAEAVMSRGLSPLELLDVVEGKQLDQDLTEALGKALRRSGVEPAAAPLFKVLEEARLQRARDPSEIERNIAALTGTLRGKLFARERLKAAGEYAMPQLLEALLQRRNATLRTEVQRLLTSEMGRSSVVPLATALPDVDPTAQELIASILGKLGYVSAAPALAELAERSQVEAVQAASAGALAALGVQGRTAAELYLELGEGYYDERDDLTAFPGEEVQLLWSHDPAIGLIPAAIDTGVFHEAMAMRSAERAMELGSDRGAASALWVSANFSREIDEPAGYDNPAYPPSKREAMYYAVSLGATVGESVLGRALGDLDTPLARRAVEAIERTAGPNRIWSRPAGVSPLVSSMNYPSRRVQYDAALAIAASHPQNPFAGSERVVPTLSSAIRFAGQRYAVVLSQTNEQYGSLRRILEGRGYTVLPYGRRIDELAEPITAAPGVDLIILQAGEGATPAAIEAIRADRRLSATPLLALVATPEMPSVSRAFDRDASVAIRPLGSGESGIGETLTALVDRAAGGEIDADEARAYAERAVRSLRDLAVGQNRVLDVSEAATSLISALSETQGPIRTEIAEVLSRINRADAQRALGLAAFETGGSERIALLDALAGSARRFGNLLDQPLVDRVIELAETGSDDEATSAAAVIGALGLSQRDLVRLILAGG